MGSREDGPVANGCNGRGKRRLPTMVITLLVILLVTLQLVTVAAKVTYDHKAIMVNGKRRILLSGSIHYPRSTPEMWPDLIQKAKDGGLDVIQTYVFWNAHEPSPGQYYFEDRFDLVRFVKLVQQAGLYMHLRIGPYICAEWNFGGFPVWLKYVPGIQFRTDNKPFKDAMESFTKKIVDMMKAENLFESQSGPIIMSQIENEFGPLEWDQGAPAKAYASWAASMAVGLNTGVPWIMCKQDDAPDQVINTCNGFYCDWFTPNRPNKPTMWTEAWTAWYTAFGLPVPHRPPQDVAFAVAAFIQKGGSFVNYYMYHGGTNFGRTSGGPFIATSYDYDAPIDEYGLLRQPKYGHLKDLHSAIKQCEPAIVTASDPVVTSLGHNLQSSVFNSSSGCAAFLGNFDWTAHLNVTFNGVQYELPPWSFSILPDCKTVVYNTARVSAQTSQMTMNSVESFTWESYTEEINATDKSAFTNNMLMEQLNLTRDKTDYLWYNTYVDIGKNEKFLSNGQDPSLSIMSAGHAMNVFVNGKLAGTAYGGIDNPRVTFKEKVKMWSGSNTISILNAAVGLPNVGEHFEAWNVGILGPVTLEGLDEGPRDLTFQKWVIQVGLKGEALNLYTPAGSSSVQWEKASLKQPLTWYKALFNAPGGNEPLALDMSPMSKGQVWINGQSIGRYWPACKAVGDCPACDYKGNYSEKTCQSQCGDASQKWYHVPRSWLKPTGNLIVLFEEIGGDPTGISLVKRTVGSICAYVEDAPEATVKLSCDMGKKITAIKFASYGTPKGMCSGYSEGACHAHKSYDPFQQGCVDKPSCAVNVTAAAFGGDPCPGTIKTVAVEATCG